MRYTALAVAVLVVLSAMILAVSAGHRSAEGSTIIAGWTWDDR